MTTVAPRPTTSAAPPVRPKRWAAGGRITRGVIGVVVLILIAQALSWTGVIPETVLPPMFDVLGETVGLLGNAEFLADLGSTMLAWAIGLAAAAVIGVALGLILGSFRIANEAASAVVEFLRPIPSVALIPLAILILGQGTDMKVALVIYASVWPILFNTIYGVRDVDPIAKETARTFRLSRFAVLTRVSLPWAAPFAATGIRISAAIALIVTISAELLAGSAAGIGAFVLRVSSGGGDLAVVFAGTVIAGLLGMLINVALVVAENAIFRWKSAGSPS